MKIIIAGSRTFNDYDSLVEFCDKKINGMKNVEIVSGGAKGADALGERYAAERGYELTKFEADWTNIEGKESSEIGEKNGYKYWKMAGLVRNGEMARYADGLLLFWSGNPRSGSANMLKQAKQNNLKIREFIHE